MTKANASLTPVRTEAPEDRARRRFGLGEAGMTLTEVAASLGLLAGILMVMSPVFSQLLGIYHLRGATQQVFAELQRARLAAVMENHRFRFTAVNGSGHYEIHDDKDNDGVEDSGEVSLRGVDFDNPGVVLLGDDAGVTFLPNGTALTYGTITVSHYGGRTKSVVVSSGGRIRTQ